MPRILRTKECKHLLLVLKTIHPLSPSNLPARCLPIHLPVSSHSSILNHTVLLLLLFIRCSFCLEHPSTRLGHLTHSLSTCIEHSKTGTPLKKPPSKKKSQMHRSSYYGEVCSLLSCVAPFHGLVFFVYELHLCGGKRGDFDDPPIER